MSTSTSLSSKDLDLSRVVDGLASLLRAQQKMQERLVQQLMRQEIRDNQLAEALREVNSSLALIHSDNKEYYREHLRGQKQNIQTQRAVLRELQNSNRSTPLLSGVRSASFSRTNEEKWGHKLLECANPAADKTLEDVSINSISLKSSMRPPLQHLQSCAAQIQTSPQESPLLQKRDSVKQEVILQEPAKSYSSEHVDVSFDCYRIASLYDYEKLVPQIAHWSGHLYSVLSQRTFELARNRQLTKEQIKVFFSSNLILNSVNFMGYVNRQYPYIWRPHRNEIIKQFNLQSKNALKYLMVKYAVNKRECVDHWCDQYIREIDSMMSPENDSLSAARIRFDYNKDKHYAGKIKELLNLYVRMTKKYFGMFQRQVNKSVTVCQQPTPQEPGYVVTAPDPPPTSSCIIGHPKAEPSFLGPYYESPTLQIPDLSPMLTPMNSLCKSRPVVCQPAEPSQQSLPTKTVRTLVGCKFRSNTGLYMPDELKEKGIKIKTAEVLRVIIKWIEDLEKRFNDINKYTVQRESPFPHKDPHHEPVTLTSSEKQMLRDTINASIEKFRAMHQQNSEVRAVLSSLYNCIEMNKHGFHFIPENEVVVGLATYILSEPVSKITVSYLQSLIHCMLEGEHNFNIKSNRQPISLMSFGVYDLLRAKCTGTKEEITEVYANLVESKQLKVVRVKNRLDSINRDFLVNVKLVGTPLLCEVQLQIDNESEQVDSEYQLMTGFSHFLYELDRSKYGPLIEAVIVNNHLCPTIPYFEQELKEARIKTLEFEVSLNSATGEVSVVEYTRVTEESPFTCSNCWRFVYPQESFMQSFEQEDKQHRDQPKRICGECIVERLPRNLKKQCLLGELASVFEEVKLSDLTSMRTNRCYVCVVLAGVKKNVRVLELQFRPTERIAEFTDTFLMASRCGEMYEMQELSIVYAFKLSEDSQTKRISWKELTANDIVSNPEISVQTLVNRKQSLLAVQLSARKKLILDEWLESPSEMSAKESRINNLRGICEHLKEQTQSSKESRSRIKDFVESGVICISGKHINSLDLFLTKHLKKLNVSNNVIGQLDFKGCRLQALEEIDVSHNALQQMCLQGGALPVLSIFNASYNSIAKVDMGKELNSLSELNLSHNKLRSLGSLADIMVPSLRGLILDYNLIAKLELYQKNLPELRILSLLHNCLTEVVGLGCLTKLENLNLSTNFLKEFIFDGENYIATLRMLSLNANRLKKTQWNKPLQLQELSLQFNYLYTFPMEQFLDGKLEKLNVSYNRLTELSCDWQRMPNLKDLQIERNRLIEGRFDRNSFRPISHVKLMETRRFLYDFTDEEVENLLNWQLNQLPAEHADAIIKFITDQKDPRISPSQNTIAPMIRFDFIESNAARDLINNYSLVPDDNPIASARPDFRTSSLSLNQATRFRRPADDN